MVLVGRRERLATEAISILCCTGFIEIRYHANRRRETDLPAYVPGGVDHEEWIRIVADACHNLPGH